MKIRRTTMKIRVSNCLYDHYENVLYIRTTMKIRVSNSHVLYKDHYENKVFFI